MAWQNLLVVIVAGVVLVGAVVLVLYVVAVKREAASWKAKHAAAVDVIARLKDREQIGLMDDKELHDEVLALLDGYTADDGGSG